MAFELPPRSQVGVLDISLDEGEKVLMSDGEQVNWNPPPVRPVVPDWSQIKSIRRYFNRTGYQVWPSWVYHPTEKPRILMNAQEAAELGICYRKSTADEQMRYGHKAVWDWKDDFQWRPQPWAGVLKFDHTNPSMMTGKIFVARERLPGEGQDELVKALIPQVAAAVAIALKGISPTAPEGMPAGDWKEFQEFLAWKKTTEAVATAISIDSKPILSHSEIVERNALSVADSFADAALQPEVMDERAPWAAMAEERGIKVDKRWGLERLKAEVEKAA